MIAPKFLPFLFKQIVRHRTRSLLTLGGTAVAMFLFGAVQAVQQGMRQATELSAKDTVLVVYRENRFCPYTSRLPEHYTQRIERIAGVESVVPMKVLVNNCRTSLDVVTFRGVPPEHLEKFLAGQIQLIGGSVQDWSRRQDSILVGETLAKRRGLKLGDMFEANGLRVYVAGILHSDEPQNQNVGYVHLRYLQYSQQKETGIVTQFTVRVKDPALLDSVASAIDAEFKSDQEPTTTRPEKAFVARAAGDLLELIRFTKWVALACVAAVLALVGNTIVLAVQDRVREHAVMQTLGFRTGLIARLIVAEGLLLSVSGGAVGIALVVALLKWGNFSLSNEGLSINFSAGPQVWLIALGVSVLVGILAGLVPAWQASRREIAASFRAV
ncbi:MAG TPA: ABC transporter permease [Planctomycetota bacterium]|jgi:putative ABC transport system permease protein